jgi:CheY-like chemotaxis protein
MNERLKIMVVDDDRTSLEVTAATLESRGHEVIRQDTALGTSMMVLREKPDVVLLDVRMPGLSGDRLAGLISGRGPGSPRGPLIIFHSSLPAAELKAFAERAKVSGVIEKSASPAEFLARFDTVIAAQGPKRTPGTP